MSDLEEFKKWDPSECDPEVLKSFRKLCLLKIKEFSDQNAMESFAQNPGPVSWDFHFLLRNLTRSKIVKLLGMSLTVEIFRF